MVLDDGRVDVVEEVVRDAEEREGRDVARVDLHYLLVCVSCFVQTSNSQR